MKAFTVTTSAALVLALAGPALAQDSDGDGAVNSIDGFPCDASLAGQSFAPAQDASALLIFEDQWPNWGDLDTNDVVIAYNVVQDVDGSGQAVHLQMTLDVVALGGVFDNGLGLRLPVPASNVSAVTLSIDGGTPVALVPSATDTNLTVVLQQNLRDLFGSQTGQINSRSDLAGQAGLSMLLDVTFANPVSLSAALAPFDTYIFRSGNTSHEIHRSMYPGTSQMDSALFGTLGDNSGNGRYFVDADGIPAAIVLPETAPYPKEAVQISTLFPNILPWAQSGGTTNQDFFVSNVVTSAKYVDVNGAGPMSATRPTPLHADTTCLPSLIGHGTDAITTGLRHNCVLNQAGNPICWGSAFNGIYGQNALPSNAVYTKIFATSTANCGLAADGSITCANAYGAGPRGTYPGPFVDFGGGWHSLCAVAADGTALCVGSAVSGLQSLTQVASIFDSMTLSASGLCGIYLDGSTFCGGTTAPTTTSEPFAQIQSNRYGQCGLRSDGSVTCWGGTTYLTGINAWLTANPMERFSRIALAPNARHMCAIRLDGSVLCLGSDADGVMTKAPSGGTFIDVVAGTNHACAVRSDGTVACWGSYSESIVPPGLSGVGL
jgi:LruC domain-containing protein